MLNNRHQNQNNLNVHNVNGCQSFQNESSNCYPIFSLSILMKFSIEVFIDMLRKCLNSHSILPSPFHIRKANSSVVQKKEHVKRYKSIKCKLKKTPKNT